MRLTRGREFLAVRHGGARVSIGPLVFSARPNGLPHCRLGLSIGARVGKAVARNQIKRRLREAFRLMQHEGVDERAKSQAAAGAGYDVIVSARPHEPLSLAEYQRFFAQAMRDLHQSWLKKQQRRSSARTDTDPKSNPPSGSA